MRGNVGSLSRLVCYEMFGRKIVGGLTMNYISTRDNYSAVSAAKAVSLGMVPTGGLFVPEKLPDLSREEIMARREDSYQETACWVLNQFLQDYSQVEIEEAVKAAYSPDKFPAREVTPIKELDSKTYMLELWHGPTAAFKDLALQLLPYLLVKARNKLAVDKDILILTATSGDTGKAALEGFKNVAGVKIVIFFPEEGVSRIQKRQMLSTEGENTEVVAVRGDFDDCQSAVKEVFADREFKNYIAEKGYQFSSANSINWGRLAPQIVYYFVAYHQLLKQESIKPGEGINVTVPTGNFGNILAAYYARQLGLPVKKLLCASNENKVLADFLQTGIYDIERELKQTISPSMDILISSNLERFLFEVTGHDSSRINSWYDRLSTTGQFEVDAAVLKQIQEIFAGYYAREKEVKVTIKEVYKNYDYLIDPHTAVAVKCLRKYRRETADHAPAVVASTANPYKFPRAVLEGLQGEAVELNEFQIIEKLLELTGTSLHRNLQGLKTKEIKHGRKAERAEIKAEIKDILS